MNSVLKVVCVLSLLFNVGLILVNNWLKEDISTITNELNACKSSKLTLQADLAEYTYPTPLEMEKLKNAIKEVGEKEYIEGKYMCVDFAKDLVLKLRKLGIDSKMIVGLKSEYKGQRRADDMHAWVSIEISPEDGSFMSDNKYEATDICDIDDNKNAKCLNGVSEGNLYGLYKKYREN